MSKFTSFFQLSKKKLGIVALSSALVLAVSTGATFASQNSTKGGPKKVLQRNVDGVTQSSTDGKHWVIKSQKDAKLEREGNGKIVVTNGKSPDGKWLPPKKDGPKTIMVKREKGKLLYSSDGGKTWSDKLPKGVKVTEKNGKIRVTYGHADDSKAEVRSGVKKYHKKQQ